MENKGLYVLVPTDEEEKKKKFLQHVMNLISERRLQFSTYLAGFAARDKLNHVDEAIAEAYLSGIDDANRIIMFVMGIGPDIKTPDFFKKAKMHKASDYGAQNLSPEEAENYLSDEAVLKRYQQAIGQNEKILPE